MAKKYVVPGRYIDQHALEVYFGKVFGYGKAQVTCVRGAFQCTLPRALTQEEWDKMKSSVEYGHYDDV
ncbi:uncharacterized protein EKO05_0001125 [Ascochyta rabiei]|uniref:uncharacterized protein n=1 Tax=Didymella rabiei TaxID=5454 RepID=UPI0021FD554A|nr:uncharacterized protein EKO05_0001125 [Ascochyta rabiei]UPX10467.1 hypothetical protein EKO05_0001125 [Ascochyta rabiei]